MISLWSKAEQKSFSCNNQCGSARGIWAKKEKGKRKFLAAALLLFAAIGAGGQTVSSSVKGVIADPNGAVVVGAACKLTDQATAKSLAVQTDSTGTFTFLNVFVGTYKLRVEASGFQTLETVVTVEANQIRTLGELRLKIGGATTEVNVTDEVAQIQLASAEKSGTITGDQLQNLAIKGRDMFSVLQTIPGVVDNSGQERIISTPDQVAGTNIDGNRDSAKNFTVDGITNLDTGSNQTVHYTVSPDAIQEIKVLTSNYQPEYGRSAGGAITVITKSGTRDFHGSAYYFGRNESLNATSWDANHYDYAVKKPIERAGIEGFSLGGPIYIPRKINTAKNKLFFFVSEEWSNWLQPSSTSIVSVPTQAERNGDFSHSYDVNGNLIVAYNPQTQQPWSGNIIPSGNISSLGQKVLSFFPLPNYTNPINPNAGNYQSQYTGDYKRRADMFRIDANITPTLSAYFRFNNDMDEQNQPWGNWVTSMNWLLTPISFNQPGYGLTANVTKIFSQTLVNEFNFGKSHNHLVAVPSDPSKWMRSQVGIPEWFGGSDYLPNISFGSRHYTPANISVIGSFPYQNTNDIYSALDNLSKVWGKHMIKIGVYFERTGKLSPLWTTQRGSLSFSRSTLDPLDTNDGFSNALQGIVTSYAESTQGGDGDWWFNNTEWYAQDNWKVTSRLTLDYGVRFYHIGPVIDHNHTMSTFNPALYDPSQAPRLYEAKQDPSTGAWMGYDASTNTWVPQVAIGALVPQSGNFNDGSCAAGSDGCPEGLATYTKLDLGPRLGVAYDVFGNGKTALHLGGGIFKDRGSILPPVYAAGSPPVGYTSTAYYTTLDGVSSAPGYRFPSGGSWTSGAWAFYGRMKTPTVTNYSLGVQQELLRKLVLDVSYVGGISRHLWVDKDINPIPIGARFNPANAGAWNDNFMRVYMGYSDITGQLYTGTANYNALQAKLNRSFSHGLQVGASYTYSKAMGVTSTDGDAVSSYFNPRDYNYGPLAYDRKQSLIVNYWYDIPDLGKRLDRRLLGVLTDHWSISGITSFISGAPATPSIYWDAGYDVTGSTDGARGELIGDPYKNVPAGMVFNPSAFAPTPVNTYGHPNFGNVPNGILRVPGINNWDMTMSKQIPLGKDAQRYVQFKADAFNVFNHTQYAGYDDSLDFAGTGTAASAQLITTPTTGQYTSARDPRKWQFSLRLAF